MNTKPFRISKQLVWEAWKQVKANGGSHGIDAVTLEVFEANLSKNLYRIWNRMSSGSYFPPAVRRVDIPKGDDQTRPLGIPTVGDRVAQTVVKMVLEPQIDPAFHPDSYGYRPGKSAIDAVRQARQRCWHQDWVVDLDIKGFFDNINHDLLMKAVRKHTDNPWVILHIERWLKAPVAYPNGDVIDREMGTPQGGVISPLLANLFLHYALDVWVGRHYPNVGFERYADDCVFHCSTCSEAETLLKALDNRLKECHLSLHPGKTKIVYCKDSNRKGGYPQISFDFLGYTFRPRSAKAKHGKIFTGYTPALSRKALKRISNTIRSWKLQRWSGHNIEDIARALNPVIAGWVNYYGHFGRKELYRIQNLLDFALIRWARKKFKKLTRSYRKSKVFMGKLRQQQPGLFVHWNLRLAG
ncbi:RNA-directed DNA polymerase [Aliiroseovarius crassostreae]|uniref:RNA-directed DNA polymerase n=1 Tax=Aliiroseovarius crassostreae TaxID=154981 RepID=A0A0P7KI47_9RHOB|nr:group II intron reverse transcriptase/maturase [Aliiroseovarius crassostreae]KPN61558.1 group II intron reverse transcriptase/maturase [Aliiroseovarius crassostreae]SFU92493.1 RNA-directed DNA polymerase [Aliiroseovarius crassostreae]